MTDFLSDSLSRKQVLYKRVISTGLKKDLDAIKRLKGHCRRLLVAQRQTNIVNKLSCRKHDPKNFGRRSEGT